MAKHNRNANATPRATAPTAPQLVVGTSLAQALANAMPAPQPAVPGALASSASVGAMLASPAWANTPIGAASLAVAAQQAAVHPTQQVVGLGKPYNVRAGTAFNNVRSWQLVQAYLAANGGAATVGQIAAHLQAQVNHANFAGYCVRRGYLAPVQPVAPTA